MLLRQVVLHNFAGFGGRQVVDLTPSSPDKPVVLFGGLNGSGKTTILDALQLVLYGKRARCSSRANLAYDEYLRRSIHRSVGDREGAAIELCFDTTFDGQVSTFRVHRSWEPTDARGVRERLMVSRDDIDSALLTERWDDLVEELLPLEISSLFFFDGEKIEALADPERAGRVIATAVESLLGLNLLDRLSIDLVALERRKRSIASDAGAREQLARLEELVAAARADRSRSLQERASHQNEVDRAEGVLAKTEATFQRDGGGLFARKGELEQRRGLVRDRLADVHSRLVDLASGPMPLRLVGGLLDQVAQQRQVEKDAQTAQVLADVLEGRDAAMLGQFETAFSKPVARKVERFLSADRQERLKPANAPRYLHATEDFDQRLSFVWPNELERAAAEAQELLKRRDALQAELDEADRELAAVPSEDALADARRRCDAAAQTLTTAKAGLAVSAEVLAKAERALAEHEAKLQAAYRDAASTVAAEEDARRIVDHATRVRETLNDFRGGLLRRHLSRIEAAVLDSLRRLLRKQHLVADLRLNPETFELMLFDRKGDLVPPERLSAGERQLLAIALLWGLARVSGRRLPMVIDTPLGRLDSSHRQLIVERYFPNASHQVLLLSTDEEIDETLLASLDPFIGRSYELQHDDAAGHTSIVDGYFWREAIDVA